MIDANGGPAFPVTTEQYDYGFERVIPKQVAPGMTLRDYFAAKALPGLIEICQRDSRDEGLSFPEHIAACAYGMADAMLKARQAQEATQ